MAAGAAATAFVLARWFWLVARRRKYSELSGAWCGLFRVIGLSPYWGLLGPRNWELIQPFKPVFSTWTQSPSRLVAVNRVPLGAEPRTGAFPEGADLMFTPGRCKKTKSRFCAAEVVWGVTALGATWGEVSTAGGTTPDAPRDGSGTAGAGCTGVRRYWSGFCRHLCPWRGQDEVREPSNAQCRNDCSAGNQLLAGPKRFV